MCARKCPIFYDLLTKKRQKLHTWYCFVQKVGTKLRPLVSVRFQPYIAGLVLHIVCLVVFR